MSATARKKGGALRAKRDGLHVLELFGGIGLGVVHIALFVGYIVRCYTYVDKDSINRRIVRTVLNNLQQQYSVQLSNSATRSFDKQLPWSISLINSLFLSNLVARNGPIAWCELRVPKCDPCRTPKGGNRPPIPLLLRHGAHHHFFGM